jgi:hypothetical protein
MIVTCKQACWDSKRCIKYAAGDTQDVDPLEPIAMYFAFPAGTKVYCKKNGIEGTEISTGLDKIPNPSGIIG